MPCLRLQQKKKIKKVVIKKGVTELPEDAFKECDRVTDISIASSVKKIGAKAFFNTGVKKITIPKKAVNLGMVCFKIAKIFRK